MRLGVLVKETQLTIENIYKVKLNVGLNFKKVTVKSVTTVWAFMGLPLKYLELFLLHLRIFLSWKQCKMIHEIDSWIMESSKLGKSRTMERNLKNRLWWYI